MASGGARGSATGGEARTWKVFVHTFGCQMNVYDSLRMVQRLGEDGGARYVETKEPAEADLILINTCSVREKPQAKVRSTLGRYARLRPKNPDLLIGVAGCVAAQEKERLLTYRPGADFVIGPDAVGSLPEIVAEARASRAGVVHAEELPIDDYTFVEARPLGDEGVSAMITAMKGCDNYCSYCIVPYVRGREVSKPAPQILAEVRRHVDAGVREVMLLGQNVNRYGLDRAGEMSFPDLLRACGAIAGLDRLMFTTSHPRDFSDDLIRCFAEIPALLDYLHLPFQAGSNAVLERMNRGYTREEYLDLVARIRDARPSIHLSADVIVGFPGETDADFAQTLDVLEQVRFGSLYSFQYSPRPGTKAAELTTGEVPLEERSARLRTLQELQAGFTEAALASHVGELREVLVEGLSRSGRRAAPGEHLHQVTGRCPARYIVNFAAPSAAEAQSWVGRLARVRIERACGHSLRGALVAIEPWDEAAAAATRSALASTREPGEEA